MRSRYYLEGKPTYIWCSAFVERLADGMTDKLSENARKLLPADMAWLRWPEDRDFEEEESWAWLQLEAKKFNKNVHNGWRVLVDV